MRATASQETSRMSGLVQDLSLLAHLDEVAH
jgi:hypothetical protein